MERSKVKKRLLFGVALLMVSIANFAQTGSETGSGTVIQGDTDGGTLSYIGDYTRLSIGYDSELDLYGEYFQVFGENTRSAWIGQGWLADDAGGLQLNYHWMSGSEEADEDAHINKIFVAVDQNQQDDRKLTLGYGFEKRDYFLGAYASKSLTDERFVGQRLTPDATISIFEHPYDYGVGFRGGRFFEESLFRLRGGVDYEWGEEDSSQITLSFSGEKFFYNSPHSLALHTEFLNKSGDFETDDEDARVRLLYRYSFGESYRSTRPTVQAAPVAERRVIRNDISLSTDAFFNLDESSLRNDAAQALNDLIQQLQDAEVVGNVQIIGHTCDLGSTPYNQRLSERRANTVRDYFVSRGFSPAALEAEGRGELEPKFPNDGEPNRSKNRRVDIAVMTVEEIEQPAAGPIQVQSAPAWIQRGLRNPVEHKRTVDYYRIEQAQANDDGGGEEDNNPPVAVDDNVTVDGAVVIDVLANDSDPDGDTITIVSVTQPANGSVVNNGDSVIYTPNPGFAGTDTFTYTIQDSDGNTSTATVTVTVEQDTPPIDQNNPPDAVDDRAVTNRNTPVTIDVLANDSDPDGDDLTITAVTQGEHGSVVNNGGDVTYTPDQGFRGTDTFTYTISDGNGGSDTATVTVVIPRY